MLDSQFRFRKGTCSYRGHHPNRAKQAPLPGISRVTRWRHVFSTKAPCAKGIVNKLHNHTDATKSVRSKAKLSSLRGEDPNKNANWTPLDRENALSPGVQALEGIRSGPRPW